MSKLETIKRSLESNLQVVIEAIQTKTDAPDTDHFPTYSHWVDIFISPRDGMFTAKELQEFMMSVVPVESTERDDFEQQHDVIKFGRLFFDEVVGNVVITGDRTITFTEPDVDLDYCYTGGIRMIENDRITEPLLRRITLSIFPDSYHARRAVEGHDLYHATMPQLALPSRLRRSLLHRSGK